MRSSAAILTSITAAFVMAMPASAQDVIDATDPEAVAAVVRGFGSTRMDTAGDGTPMIRGRIDGTAFQVFFYECDGDDANCRSVSFSAGWAVPGVTIEAVNAWNRDSRFGRAYLDDVEEPILEMDVNLFEGVTAANFEDTVDWWRVVLADFKTNVVDAAGGEPSAPDASPSTGPEGEDTRL